MLLVHLHHLHIELGRIIFILLAQLFHFWCKIFQLLHGHHTLVGEREEYQFNKKCKENNCPSPVSNMTVKP